MGDRRIGAIIALGIVWSAGASAQDAFDVCAEINNDTQRLSCFDAAVAKRAAALAPPPAVPAPETAPAQTETVASAAPRNVPAGPEPAKPKALTYDTMPLPFTTTVTAYQRGVGSDFALRIAEGLVFVDAGGSAPRRRDITGQTIEIMKSGFGSWRMRLESQKGLVRIKPAS
ncbi:MAG: hypothetical protein ACFB2Z_03410 [Maricaulaceae bacterium]